MRVEGRKKNMSHENKTTKGGNYDALHLEATRHHASHSRVDLNYNAHNAPAYKFNNSATSVDPLCTHTPNFSAFEQSISGRVIVTKPCKIWAPSTIWDFTEFHNRMASADP